MQFFSFLWLTPECRSQVVRGVAGYEVEEPVSEYEVQVAVIRQTSGKWLSWLEAQDMIDTGRCASARAGNNL